MNAKIDLDTACAAHLAAGRKLNELRSALADDSTEEQRGEVRAASKAAAAATKTYEDALAEATQTRATLQEGGGNPEQLEFRSLLERYDPWNVLQTVRGRALAGVEAEINSHLGIGATELPLAAWDAQADLRRRELEARAVTPASMPSATQTVADVIPNIYADSDAGFLSIAMPMAGPGAYLNLLIGSGLGPATGAAKGSAVAGKAGAVSAKLSTPKRLTITLEMTQEDQILAGTDRLRMRLLDEIRRLLRDKINAAMIQAGGTNDPVGLLGQTTDLPDPSPTVPASGAPSYADLWTALVAQGDDGIFSGGRRDRRTLLREELYVVGSGLRYGTEDPDDLIAIMERQTGGLKISDHLPAPASNVSEVIQVRDGQMVSGAEMPTWSTLEVTDIYSKSTAAVTTWTISAFLGDVQVIYPAKYRRLRVRTGA